MKESDVQLPEPLPKFLKPKEAASLLRLAVSTIYEMVSQDRIPYRKAGGRLLFERDELLEWTRTRKVA